MKRTGVLLALALGLASQGLMAKTLNVVSSFSVLGDITRQVGGEHVHVDSLVAPDGDPHTFEPSPKDSTLLSLSLIHISEPTRRLMASRMPSSA